MANFNFNEVIIGGRLTSDPELKVTPSGISVTSFTIAVNRREFGKNDGKQTADFFNVTAWRQTAEFISRYFAKGRMIIVTGRISSRSWEGSDGKKNYVTEVVANEVAFGESKRDGGDYSSQGAAAPESIPSMPMEDGGFSPLDTDDDLPF